MMMFTNTFGNRPFYSMGFKPNPFEAARKADYRYVGNIEFGDTIIIVEEPQNGWMICLTKFGLGKTWTDNYDPPYVSQ